MSGKRSKGFHDNILIQAHMHSHFIQHYHYDYGPASNV